MEYCTKCLYPDTKPDLTFNDDGVCSACTSYEERKNINWDDREKMFAFIAKSVRYVQDTYSCVIPVSGGKDSTYQIIKALEYGLRPLAVTATTCDLSDIGRCNLDNIARLGVDHISVTPNKKFRKILNKHGLLTVGDISWPEHQLIFSIPVQIADLYQIPLIMWGENPQNEYGAGPKESRDTAELSSTWLAEFGGLNGMRVNDIRKIAVQHNFDLSVVNIYKYPITTNATQIFMGYYFPWDGAKNAEIAIDNGFTPFFSCVEGSGFDYENIDNLQTGIHDYFKYIKYGFGRATDICSNRIRRGYMTREEGIAHCEKWDGMYPAAYLSVSFLEILAQIDVTLEEFNSCIKRFTNPDLFVLREYPNVLYAEPKYKIK